MRAVVARDEREAEHGRRLERDEGRLEERVEVGFGENGPGLPVGYEHAGASAADGDHIVVLADDFDAAEPEEVVVAPSLEDEQVDLVEEETGIGFAEDRIARRASGVEEEAPGRIAEA